MGGFFGIASKEDCMMDVFFGTDYHSHLGTYSGGLAAYDSEIGLQRKIHHIDGAPFRTRFRNILSEMKGTSAIGSISDTHPEPMLIRSNLGTYAISMIGIVNNADELVDKYLSTVGMHFDAMTGGKINSTELVAALINQKTTFKDGIRFAQESIDGTASILILTDKGSIIAARDLVGRLPVLLGKNEKGYAVSFESFAYQKLGFEDFKELGPGEIVEFDSEKCVQLMKPEKKMKICSFLWSYYGYPTSTYEGVNVEAMRYRNGRLLAKMDKENIPDMKIDYVGGVPDSGTPHAIGYSNESGLPFARAFIKYTPTWSRSFMPTTQSDRNKVAKMKQIPVYDLIKGKNLLFVDDSIVRGTQLRETVEFLYENGAASVHMRSACPPIMYGCKFLNFSRSTSEMELLARRIILENEGEEGFNHLEEYADSNTERGKALRRIICEKMNFASLEFQSLEGIIESIGIDRENLCTYCWDGKE